MARKTGGWWRSLGRPGKQGVRESGKPGRVGLVNECVSLGS